MKLSKLFKGLVASTSFLFALAVGLSLFSQNWVGLINTTLGVDDVELIDPEKDSPTTQYFKTEFGDGKLNANNQALLLEAAKEQSYNEVAEGSILFKNKDNALPLSTSERKVTIFGRNVVDFVYMASNGGEGNSIVENNRYSFDTMMEEAGFQINPTLMNAYKASSIKRGYPNNASSGNNIGEAPLSLYTDTVKSSFSDYNDVAFILISREYGEGHDAMMNDNENMSELAMHQEELDMINLVKQYKANGVFNKIVVLLNTSYTVELGWCEDEAIDAVLCFGFPGQWGAKAIPDLLTGVVNPSGRTPDTWAANSLSAPACVNEGTNTPKFSNIDEIKNTIKADDEMYISYMSTMVESIYVGYKYYETRYEDVILNQGGASNPVGAIQGSSSWDYAKEMVYPFGSGLSYTSFSETIDSVTENSEDHTYSVKVTVKNTGSVAGKHSVQVYANTPYGDYEKTNLVEKAAVNIVGFGKTALLEPNEQETLDIKVEKYLLASYDSKTAKGYILSEGDYYLGIGNSSHDALNNILKKKGASGMIDELGNPVAGDEAKAYTWHMDFNSDEFANSLITGNRVTNRFESTDLNYFFDEAKVTYISRQDWAGTYPTAQTVVAATQEMMRLMAGNLYQKAADAPSMRGIITGDMTLNIPLIKLRGKDFDDPLWDEYFKQWTVDELASWVAEGYGTKPFPKFGIPKAVMLDGPLGVVTTLPYNNREKCTTWPCEPILAATCNEDIIYRRGQMMGEHCLWTKTQSINGPGCNLHRTPFNGRNPIYFSEDGNMTYLVARHEGLGYRSKGASAGAKHFCLNDQEFARQGVCNFIQEQAIRETSLRGFESILTGDVSYACMMAFNRIGCVSQNSDYHTKAVTREEWGFKGFLQSDATIIYSKDRITILDSGLDLFTADGSGQSTKAIKNHIKNNDDGYIYQKLVLAVKHSQYNVVNSNVMNGISEQAQIIVHTPWWTTTEIAICVVMGVLVLASCTMMVLTQLNIIGKKKQKEAE